MEQTETEIKLTARQSKAIPIIIDSASYTEAAQRAGISRKTFYQWLKQPEFAAELDRQRGKVVSEAFGVLSQSITKAVETLAKLLDSADERTKRLTANDIIGHILRHKEVDELESRITAIEQRLEGTGS